MVSAEKPIKDKALQWNSFAGRCYLIEPKIMEAVSPVAVMMQVSAPSKKMDY